MYVEGFRWWLGISRTISSSYEGDEAGIDAGGRVPPVAV